jgi:hypothetical protein
MQRSTFAILGAAIAFVGIGGAALPGLVDAGNPVAYLREASHGHHGTTTGSDRPDFARLHGWNNEAMPIATAPSQVPLPVPESGGTPREALP